MLHDDTAADSAEISLKNDLLVGVTAIADCTGDPERRIRNYVQKADEAAEAGEPDDGNRASRLSKDGEGPPAQGRQGRT